MKLNTTWLAIGVLILLVLLAFATSTTIAAAGVALGGTIGILASRPRRKQQPRR